MKTKSLVMVLIGVVIVLASCTKDEKTTTEKIQGKWTFVSDVDTVVINGQKFPEYYTGTADDYLTFSSDGKFAFNQDGSSASGEYSLNNDKLSMTYLVDQVRYTVLFTITTLTDNSLVIYRKNITDANNYEVEIVTFKK
jgi:hypothetical protein